MSKNTKSLTRTTVKLLRWHRRIGLVLALLIVLLAVTGIAINHTHELKLSKSQLNHPWLLAWYGLDNDTSSAASQQIHGISIGDNWLSAGDNTLYINQNAVTDCPGSLLGATLHQQNYLVLCRDQLALLSASGDLLEAITPAFGLPDNARNIVSSGNAVFLLVSDQPLQLNLETLQTAPAPEQTNLHWPELQPLPAQFQTALFQTTHQSSSASISLETLLLDIHSGRILGRFGVFLADAAAVLVCLLALSGLWAWFNHKRLIQARRR